MLLLSQGLTEQAWQTSDKSISKKKKKNCRSSQFKMNMCKGVRRQVNFLLSVE
jgi:hypothetical protein